MPNTNRNMYNDNKEEEKGRAFEELKGQVQELSKSMNLLINMMTKSNLKDSTNINNPNIINNNSTTNTNSSMSSNSIPMANTNTNSHVMAHANNNLSVKLEDKLYNNNNKNSYTINDSSTHCAPINNNNNVNMFNTTLGTLSNANTSVNTNSISTTPTFTPSKLSLIKVELKTRLNPDANQNIIYLYKREVISTLRSYGLNVYVEKDYNELCEYYEPIYGIGIRHHIKEQSNMLWGALLLTLASHSQTIENEIIQLQEEADSNGLTKGSYILYNVYYLFQHILKTFQKDDSHTLSYWFRLLKSLTHNRADDPNIVVNKLNKIKSGFIACKCIVPSDLWGVVLYESIPNDNANEVLKKFILQQVKPLSVSGVHALMLEEYTRFIKPKLNKNNNNSRKWGADTGVSTSDEIIIDQDTDTLMSVNSNNYKNKNSRRATSVCFRFKATGECPYGDSCIYTHNDDEDTNNNNNNNNNNDSNSNSENEEDEDNNNSLIRISM